MRGQGETGVHKETSSGLLLRCQEGLQAETQGRVQAAVRPGAEADLRPRLRDQVREHLGASLPPGAPITFNQSIIIIIINTLEQTCLQVPLTTCDPNSSVACGTVETDVCRVPASEECSVVETEVCNKAVPSSYLGPQF